jgi:hypothetical protein
MNQFVKDINQKVTDLNASQTNEEDYGYSKKRRKGFCVSAKMDDAI